MIQIGAFSKIAKISVRMLRHYDQIGLLKPAYIDTSSGYRSYSIDQLARLNRIIFLKDIGFSLNEVNKMIDSNISIDNMKEMLKKRQKDLENEIAMANSNLNTVLDRLTRIEEDGKVPRFDVNVKKIESYTVASFRNIVPTIQEIGMYCYSMYSKLYEELDRLGITYIGPEVTFYNNDEYYETEIEMEVSIVIPDSEAEFDKTKETELEFKKIDARDKVAFLIYNGPFNGIETAVIELLKWIGTNNYEIVGAVREIHLSGPAHGEGKVQDQAVLELQVPVK